MHASSDDICNVLGGMLCPTVQGMTNHEAADAIEAIWTKAYIDRQKVFVRAHRELEELVATLSPEQKELFEEHFN